MHNKAQAASFHVQELFTYMTVVLNITTVFFEFGFFLELQENEIYKIKEKDYKSKRESLGYTVAQCIEIENKVNARMYIGIFFAVIQFIAALYVTAYQAVHLKAIALADKGKELKPNEWWEKLYRKTTMRDSVKGLIRLMLFEGVLCESILVVISWSIQDQIDKGL